MSYLLKRGRGNRRRVAHLGLHDPLTGLPTMIAVCGSRVAFDLSSNVPWGQRTCKRCRRKVART